MRKLMKVMALSCIFLLSFSLIACGSTKAIKDKNNVKGTETAKVEGISTEKELQTEEQKQKQEKPEDASIGEGTGEQAPTKNPNQPAQDSQGKTNSTAPSNKPAASAADANNSTPAAAAPAAPSNSTPASSTNTNPAKTEEKPQSTVTFSIVGPDNHVILAATKVSITDGDTVFDVLKQLDKDHSFDVVSRGSGATAYVEGIEGKDFSYYEFDYGPTSGWVFKLNGTSLSKSVGITKVKDGDRIECIYTE